MPLLVPRRATRPRLLQADWGDAEDEALLDLRLSELELKIEGGDLTVTSRLGEGSSFRFAVDLPAGEKEHVDAALAGAIEQFAAAVGEEALAAAAEQRDVGPAVAALARQQRGGGGDRRGVRQLFPSSRGAQGAT